MRKTICILAMVLSCILTLSGCRCSHTWDPATCDAPKTCQFCGATDGAPLGHIWSTATCDEPMFCEICQQAEGKPLPHQWVTATCTAPKTCTACGATEGEPLGHIWQAASCETPRVCANCSAEDGVAFGHTWVDATCDSPKFCNRCKLTEGDPLGHKWIAATTEAPKTCLTCGKTEGDRIITDPRFSTAACKALFGRWETYRSHTAENIGLTNQSFTFTEVAAYTFRNDGTVSISHAVENLDTSQQAMTDAIIQGLCAKCCSMEAAEQMIQGHFNMTLAEYATEFANTYFEKVQNTTAERVYFVSGDLLFMSDSWDAAMACYELALTNDRLKLVNESDEPIELTRS